MTIATPIRFPWHGLRRDVPGTHDTRMALPPAESDEDLVAACRNRWPKFGPLFDGDLSEYRRDQLAGDSSEHGLDLLAGTQALVRYFVAAGVDDPDRIDRLVRASGLTNDRWEDGEYRRWLMGTAIRSASVRGAPASGDDAPRPAHERLGDGLELAVGREFYGEMPFHLNRLLLNRGLGDARRVALALAIRFAHYEARETIAPYAIPMAEIAEAAGLEPDAAAEHVGMFAKAGLLTWRVREFSAGHDWCTGEVVPAERSDLLMPEGCAVCFAAAAANLGTGAREAAA